MKWNITKKTAAAVSACALLAGLVLFAGKYELPLPFDADRMFVEPVQAVAVTDEENGITTLTDLDHLNFADSKAVLAGKRDVIDSVRLAYRGINQAGFIARSRIVSRGCGDVRVVYFCYYKTLWQNVVYGDFCGYSESGSFFGDVCDGSIQENGDYAPCLTEIYYLPVRKMYRMDEFSDEKFDALKEKGSLVWSGVI